jgi:hypothetical protein
LDLRPYILAYLALLFQGKLALSSIYISTTQAVAGRQFSTFATNTVIANQNSTIDNYNTRYTPQGRIKAGKRGTYKKDIHVWVYTSKFAKRFGMPQEWVDDELKGYSKAN